jgi:hypothetical protein
MGNSYSQYEECEPLERKKINKKFIQMQSLIRSLRSRAIYKLKFRNTSNAPLAVKINSYNEFCKEIKNILGDTPYYNSAHYKLPYSNLESVLYDYRNDARRNCCSNSIERSKKFDNDLKKVKSDLENILNNFKSSFLPSKTNKKTKKDTKTKKYKKNNL